MALLLHILITDEHIKEAISTVSETRRDERYGVAFISLTDRTSRPRQ